MKRIIIILFAISIYTSSFSQRGKDGAVTISATSTVNAYAALSGNISAGSTTLSVNSATAFAAGDLIYIIQMQGASVNCFSNPWGNPNSPEPYNSSFGDITSYNNAGNHEFAQVASVSGTVITVDCPLNNNYTAAGKVQVVRVPRYSSLTVNATITCPQWNGTTGGVLAIEVNGNTVINAGGFISASGKGFRGGITVGKNTGLMGGGSFGHNNASEGGYKGESIAGDVLTYSVNFQGPYCKGAVANGGGGGNANNCGGGGGANGGNILLYTGTGNPDASTANYITAWNLESAGFATSSSSGGGRGGYAFSDANISPLTTGPNNTSWGGDARRNQGGLGGRPLDYSSGRIFAGGGGGAGDENDTYGGAGGNGGGIINIVSYGSITGGGQVVADGANGVSTNTPNSAFSLTGRDGAGGAGGGGAIVINSTGGITNLTLSAVGGNGGNAALRNNAGSTNNSYGPGGGGGGGYIATSAATVTSLANGGNNGVVTITGLNGSQIDNLFPPNGATRGGSGNVSSALSSPISLSTTSQGTICANNSATVSATSTGTATIGWYTQNSGGTLLGTGAVFTTSVFSTPGSYTLYAGFCPGGTYRVPAVITVSNAPVVAVSSSTICSGQNATLTASGASGYLWSNGASTTSITISPTVTTSYSVTGSNGSCSATAVATVVVNPPGTISINSPTLCSGQTATITAGAASSYTWSTGANTSSIAVSPSVTSTYTINAISGGCLVSNTATVTVNANPTVSVNNATVCSGQSATLTATGASSYLWNTGASSQSVVASPTITTNYTVTGTNGSCPAAAIATIVVTPTGTIAVNSPSVCAGQTATLSAGAASSYTWSTGANTGSLAVSPSVTTTYTINAIAGGCPVKNTATVNVNANPVITVNSPTLCSGQGATLTAAGGSSYLWSTGATTSSVAASPSVTTTFSVTGTSGSCSGTAVSTVVVNPPGTIPVNSSSVCPGQTATLTAGAASSYTWSNGSNNTAISVSPSVTTTYTVNATNGGCLVTNTATVTVNSNPTVTVNSATICSGQTTTLTAGGATSYLWNNGATTASIVISPSVSSTYTITGSNGSCTAAAVSTVIINPIGVISVNSPTLCSGQNATLTAGAATGYTWSTGANSGSIVVSPTLTSTYTINAVNGACPLVNTATVTVNSNPTVTVNNATVCAGQTATLSAAGALNYSWNTAATTSSISANPSTTQVYTVTGSNSNNCSDTKTATITVNANPTITVNSATICSNTQVTLSASGASTYSWNTGATSTSVALQPTVSTTYTVTGFIGNCPDQQTATVTIIATPTLSINSATICAGSSTVLSASGATLYSWNTGQSTPGITVSPLSNQSYTVTGYNGSCSVSATTSVTVNNTPTLSLNANSFNICASESATLIANSSSNTFSWSTGATTSQIVTSTSGTYTVSTSNSCGITSSVVNVVVSTGPPSFTVVPSSSVICTGQTVTLTTTGSSGPYTWNTGAISNSITVNTPTLYVATLANGCGTVSAFIDIGANTPPAVNISASSPTICSGGQVTLTANSAGDLLWANNSQTTSAITVTGAGVYSVTASNECGSNTASYTVVNGPAPVVSILQTGAMCSGQSVTLSASGADTYSWSTGNTTNEISITTDGTYTATGTNSCGVSIAVFTATFLPLPQVSLSAADYTICPLETTTLTATGINGGTLFAWENFPLNTTNTQTVSSSGVYTVTYSNGCGTDTAMISISESTVQADFSLTPVSGVSPLNVSFTNTSSNNSVNQWNFGNGMTSANTAEQNIQYTSPGIYTVSLVVLNSDGCASVRTRTLEVLPLAFGPIPEVITPNNDNYNDAFTINGIERYPNNHLQIFNRWGNLVYEMKNYNNSWRGNSNVNGKTEGDKLPSGTYFILLELNDGSGTVYKTYCQLMY